MFHNSLVTKYKNLLFVDTRYQILLILWFSSVEFFDTLSQIYLCSHAKYTDT